MYVARGVSDQGRLLKSTAQPTVEASLLKSRLVTKRWLSQVSRKKKELEEQMLGIGRPEELSPA